MRRLLSIVDEFLPPHAGQYLYFCTSKASKVRRLLSIVRLVPPAACRSSLYLLYWYKSTNTDAETAVPDPLLLQKEWHDEIATIKVWYKNTNTDATIKVWYKSTNTEGMA